MESDYHCIQKGPIRFVVSPLRGMEARISKEWIDVPYLAGFERRARAVGVILDEIDILNIKVWKVCLDSFNGFHDSMIQSHHKAVKEVGFSN